MRNTNLQAMIESAILAAFALVIDILPLSIKLPTGGSISFAMIPIFIIAYRWGFKSAFLGGLVWGLLQIVVGDAYILTPIQAFIEYFIAFAFIGFAGLFYRPIQKALLTSNENNLEQSNLGSRKDKPSSKQNEGKKFLVILSLLHLSVALLATSVTLLPVLFSGAICAERSISCALFINRKW
ncbi:energy-coupled thiamine transporter ThiT [Bacillus cereus]